MRARLSDIRFAVAADPWIHFVLWGLCLGSLGLSAFVLGMDGPLSERLVFVLIGVGSAPVWPGLLVAVRYTITSEQLILHCWPFRYRIPLASIREVVPPRGPLTVLSWGLSKRGVNVVHSGSRFAAYVSPQDLDRFLRCLRERVPALEER